jgi:hypothetical protein
MTFHELVGYFKVWGGDPVVHRVYLEVKYKDGTKTRDELLSAFRKKANARRYGERCAENRRNGSEEDEIEKVNVLFQNIYITDWI